MERFELGGEANCLYYVSSKCRSWIPAKTLLIFAPDSAAKSKEALESFAENGGWLETGEEDGAVLVLPLAPRGWAEEDTIRVKTLHKTVWRDTLSPDPSEVFKNIWCWETMIFAVGYEEGAVFAGNAAVCQPSLFACVAMINGVPDDYTGGEALSDRFFLPDASDHWIQKNREIPVPVWFLGQKNTGTAEAYFRRAALCPDQVRSSKGDFCCNTATTKALMAEFATRIRWKNSPDGTPARIKTEQQIRTQGEYISDSVDWNGNSYNFYTRFPSGMEHAKGLPVVICMHGHGEPGLALCPEKWMA